MMRVVISFEVDFPIERRYIIKNIIENALERKGIFDKVFIEVEE